MKAEGKKQKGSRAERMWAKLIEKYLGTPAKRMPLSGSVAGLEGDIFSPGSKFHWEIKNQEVWKPLEYYRQAKIEAQGGRIPVVVMTKNNEGFYCLLEGIDFLNILHSALKGGEL